MAFLIELTTSGERLAEWAEKNSTSYGDQKNLNDAQKVINDWIGDLKGSEKKKKQAEKVIKDINIRDDVNERNEVYKTAKLREVARARTDTQLDSIKVDDDFELETVVEIDAEVEDRKSDTKANVRTAIFAINLEDFPDEIPLEERRQLVIQERKVIIRELGQRPSKFKSDLEFGIK